MNGVFEKLAGSAQFLATDGNDLGLQIRGALVFDDLERLEAFRKTSGGVDFIGIAGQYADKTAAKASSPQLPS